MTNNLYNRLIQLKQERQRKEGAQRLIQALCNHIEQENNKSTQPKRQIKGVKLESDLVDWSKWDDLRF